MNILVILLVLLIGIIFYKLFFQKENFNAIDFNQPITQSNLSPDGNVYISELPNGQSIYAENTYNPMVDIVSKTYSAPVVQPLNTFVDPGDKEALLNYANKNMPKKVNKTIENKNRIVIHGPEDQIDPRAQMTNNQMYKKMANF